MLTATITFHVRCDPWPRLSRLVGRGLDILTCCHVCVQVLPTDVDYRVMLTFLEFYQTLLQFVNFKLYNTLGVCYPPVVDSRLDEAAAGLASIMQVCFHTILLSSFSSSQPSSAGRGMPSCFSMEVLLLVHPRGGTDGSQRRSVW